MKENNCCSTAQGEAAVAATSCGCHPDQAQEAPDHNHDQDDGCGCGHSHGEVTPHGTRNTILSVVASVVLMVGAYIFAAGPVQYIIMAGAILIAGWPILLQGVKNILKLNLDELALMTIAVIAASAIGEMPEAAIVTILFRLGEMFEDLAVSRSQREVEAVTKIIPENATLLLADGSSQVVGSRDLAIGSHILVKSGEQVPVDATILSGTSSLDTSSLTGESVAREVGPGDPVLSGMINLGGVLTCETTSTFDNSTASKIVEMVREASAKKSDTEKLISRFARVYTPIVIVLAVLMATVPTLLGFGPFTQWLSRALVLLVASCPCALVISIPLSYFAGIGAASKQGILIKGSKYMDVLANAGSVVFDKTGTLTTGKLSVSAVHAAPGYSQDEVLRLAAICESYSNHPIAKAVTSHYGQPDTAGVEDCKEITAYGMEAVIDGARVLCGSARLMEREGIDVSALPAANVYVARDNAAMGAVSVFDSPRPDAREALEELNSLGITRTAMLTGDSAAVAKQVQQMTGLGQVEADLLPQDKVERFSRIKNQTTGSALYVGDGINDSPVLAVSDAGVAMGLASDAAIQAADVVLLSDKLTSLPQAIRISRRTGRLAKFNISFALIVKLAVFVLAFLGVAEMWMAVFADVGVSILSVLNATRALRFR